MGANVVFYIISIVLIYYVDEDVFDYLALNRSWALSRSWTIVTSMFMHGGILHIAINMWMLYMFGSYVIMLVGQSKFLLLYFVGGIVGSLLFILLSPHTAVGASGAVFALGAFLAVMMPKMRVIIFPLFIPAPLWGAILFGLIVASFIPLLFGYDLIAWQAHLGGAIVGAAFGFFFRRKQQSITFLR